MIIAGNVDPSGTVLVTDSWKGYIHPGTWFSKHIRLNHSAGEYSQHGYSTNAVECFFSQLKRSIDGTHHRVSEEHLHRYVAEHDFRYSTRRMNDTDRMVRIVEEAEHHRLTYKTVTA